jgi:outer membrane murein-binding lipoprotein Lpp
VTDAKSHGNVARQRYFGTSFVILSLKYRSLFALYNMESIMRLRTTHRDERSSFRSRAGSRAAMCLALAALGLMPLLASCSNKATEEQMKTLRDLDQQRDGLRSDLQSAQNNLRDAQGKLASADRDLADCQAETRGAQEGLSRWPNVWADSADWNPPAPPPPPEKPMKGKRMKRTGK